MTKKTTNLIVIIAIILVAVISVVLAVVFTNNSKEYTYEVGNFKFARKGSDVTLTKFDNVDKKTEIELPTEVDGFKVNHIGDEAFMNDEHLKVLTLGEDIVSIGTRAFANMKNLSTIRMKSVATIGDEAFMNDEYLANINMPESLKSIGERAFFNNDALRSFEYDFDENFVVKSNLEFVGKDAFDESYLSTIIIPSSMKTIGERAFAGAGLSSIIFYEGVENIEKEAFLFDNSISYSAAVYTYNKDINVSDSLATDFDTLKAHSDNNTLPTSLKNIGERAFMKADKSYGKLILSNIVFGANLETIGTEAFRGASIGKMEFANANTKLAKYAFAEMSSSDLTVTLPANLKYIPEGLFFKTNLRSNETIKIPATVETIELGAFSGGKSTVRMEFVEGSPCDTKYSYINKDGFSGLFSKDGTVLYAVMMSSYTSTYNIPSSVRIIEKYAFTNVAVSQHVDNRPSINIPRTVSEIKAGAFSDAYVVDYNLQHDIDDQIVISDDAFKPIVANNTYLIRVRKTLNIYESIFDQFKDSKVVTINNY